MEVIYQIKQWNTGIRESSPTRDALFEFLAVSPKLKDKVITCIEKLERKSDHSAHFMVHAEESLWYIKTKHGSNAARLYFAFGENQTIWLLNGHVKKTQKRNRLEYERAKKLYKEVRAYA